MNLRPSVETVGIPVPEEFYENYVCIPISELAHTSGLSVDTVRSQIPEYNADGRAYLTVFHRLSDGEEMVSGYIFE